MKHSQDLEKLYQCAAERRFQPFEELYARLAAGTPPNEMWEAGVLRAQLMLYSVDAAALEELEQAGQPAGPPQYPLLYTRWRADGPNRFVLFPRAPGALARYVELLPRLRERLAGWYGPPARVALCLLQGEALYYMGDLQGALAAMERQPMDESENRTEAMLSLCQRFRCHLALGEPRMAEACMLDIIRMSKTCPECVAIYQSFRGWNNSTTGWSGDSPRYSAGSGGEVRPILDDRLEYIKDGSPWTTPLEAPHVAYAQQRYGEVCTLRQLYMGVFHAIYWLAAGDVGQAEAYFAEAYEISRASGVVMPFAEYGQQLTPLLQHIRGSKVPCSGEWLDDIQARVRQYEACLKAYRATL